MTTEWECTNPNCDHDGECCGPEGEHHRRKLDIYDDPEARAALRLVIAKGYTLEEIIEAMA